MEKKKKAKDKPKRTNEDRIKQVQPFFDYWLPYLGLDKQWDLAYRFDEEIEKDHHVFARIHTNDPYRKGFVIFDAACLDAAPPRETEAAVLHEILHIIMQPVSTAVDELLGNSEAAVRLKRPEETVIDHMSNILLAVKYNGLTAYNDQVRMEDLVED